MVSAPERICIGAVPTSLSVSTGGLVIELNADGSIRSASYLGFPCRFSGSLPNVAGDGKVVLFFGNLARSTMLVQRRAIQVSIATARGMEYDQTWLRCTMRIGIATHDAVGPMAMLLGKS